MNDYARRTFGPHQIVRKLELDEVHLSKWCKAFEKKQLINVTADDNRMHVVHASASTSTNYQNFQYYLGID